MKRSTIHSMLDGRSYSRRRFLNLAAIGSSLALAGCQRLTNLFGDESSADGDAIAVGTPSTEDESSLFSFFDEELLPANVLRIAFDSQPQQWDPATFSTIPAYQFGFAVYDALVWVDQSLTPKPALATDWTASPDGLSWSFSLRQDVQFHHGTIFAAEDVVHTFERLLDPRQSSPIRSVLSFIDSVEEVDDGSEAGAVRFNLNAPNADLPLLCGAPQARIVSHEYGTNMLTTEPSGTGPFRFVDLAPNERVILQKNDRYWNQDAVQLEEIHHVYIESAANQLEALQSGAIDLIPDMGARDAASLAEHDEISILQGVGGAYQSVIMRATEEPFTDIRVRKALKICLDRPALLERVLQGQGHVASDHPVAPFNPFAAEMAAPVADIDEARVLLAEAGFPTGLKLDLITSTSRPGMIELAEAVRDLAAPAGFEIVPTPVPADVYWETYWQNVPFHIGNWNFRPSIDETLTIAYHSEASWNEGGWKNPEFDALIEEARSKTEMEQRKELYTQAQHLLADDGAVVIPYFRPIFSAVHKRVEGFMQHPAGWLLMLDITAAEA